MKPVLLEREGSIARIVLNRPEKGNAIATEMAAALADAATGCARDDSVRCVVLTGTGRMFCAGGDIAAFASAPEGPGPFLRDLADRLHTAVRVLVTMDKPLLTLVNGPAAGAGLSLALLGDVVIAHPGAHFTAAYTALGLSPDGGMSWLLPRAVGMKRAQEIVLTNRRISAREALAIGMVTRVAEEADFGTLGVDTARQLAAAPRGALSAARRLLLDGASADFGLQLDREAVAIAAAGARPECREGLDAFLERRAPDFTGKG